MNISRIKATTAIKNLPLGVLFLLGWVVLIALIPPSFFLYQWANELGGGFDLALQNSASFTFFFYLLLFFACAGMGLTVVDIMRND